jgi:hypothetical protein
MTAALDIDPRRTPGALQTVKTRTLPDGGLIEFEFAPAGWLTQDGKPRQKDRRAYYFTPAAADCVVCSGSGRVAGKTATGKKCPACKGTGNASKRTRLPSVTTLLDAICPKGGLPPWSEARGIEGAIEAVRRGLINPVDPASVAMAVEIVRAERLGADRARDDAADRGLNVHDALEHYMRTGEPPQPHLILPEHHGYYQALVRWLLDYEPEPEAVEELVVHPELGYAGRLDLRARLPKHGGVLATIDAKTQENGGIYLGAHAQVNLYERAAVRCGDEPAEHLLIVVFAANGDYRPMPADHPDAFTDAALAWIEHGRPVDAACERANNRERESRKAVAA